MTYYVVKVVSEATKENKNFAGKKIVSYYGKDGHLIDTDDEYLASYKLPIRYCLRNYGYSRLCDAKRSWMFKNPENTEHWKSTTEIVLMGEC